MISLHLDALKGWTNQFGEDTYKSESCRYVDQDGHGEEVENMFSFCGSSRLRTRGVASDLTTVPSKMQKFIVYSSQGGDLLRVT